MDKKLIGARDILLSSKEEDMLETKNYGLY